MNASMLRLAVLVGTIVFMVCPSKAVEPKSAAQTTPRAKSYAKNEGLTPAVPKNTKGTYETSSQQSVPAAQRQGTEQQFRQSPWDRTVMVPGGDQAANPLRPWAVPSSNWRTLPNRKIMPQNPFQQPAVAIPMAATIGGRLPIQYAGPGAQPTQFEKAQFAPVPTAGFAPKAPRAPTAPRAPRAG